MENRACQRSGDAPSPRGDGLAGLGAGVDGALPPRQCAHAGGAGRLGNSDLAGLLCVLRTLIPKEPYWTKAEILKAES